jgi:phage terminase large subunit GpA-like protein
MSPEVFDGLTAERLVTRYIKGHAKLEWVKPAGRRNEPLDGAVYALAAAHYRGIDRWKEGEWHRWEMRVQSPDLFEGQNLAPAESSGEGAQPTSQEAAAAPATEVEVHTYAPPVPGPGGRISLGNVGRFKRPGA